MKNKDIFLTINDKKYILDFDYADSVGQEIINNLPIKGNARNIGGEIFFIIDLDIPFNSKEKEIFDVGDVVYWRSQKEEKFAIALFYGNTKFGTGNAPTAASPCVKFASIRFPDVEALKKVANETKISITA